MFRLTQAKGMEAVTGRPLDEEIERVEKVLADLKAIRAGAKPHDMPGIEDSPIIDQYTYGRIAIPCLYGNAMNHPRLGTGPLRTSDIWINAEEYGAVRTLSRWYRLGRPLEGNEAEGDLDLGETRMSGRS